MIGDEGGGASHFKNISVRNQVIKGQERSMRSFLQKLWRNPLKPGLRNLISNKTQQIVVLSVLLFFKFHIFEVNISIVMNPIVLYFLNSSEPQNSIFIFIQGS